MQFAGAVLHGTHPNRSVAQQAAVHPSSDNRCDQMPTTYPTQEDVLAADPLPQWIDKQYLRADPHAFSAVGFRPVVDLVSEDFQVDANGIYCIGSGAIGLSMNPKKIQQGRLKEFDEKSDLDLAVISEEHFERAWRDLRLATQPTLPEIDGHLAENISWQRKRFFDGAIIANELLPHISFGSEWLNHHAKLTAFISTMLERNVTVNFWIYRDYWSVRNYVASGIVRCRKALA